MALSDDLRDELARSRPRRRCCRLAELSALFHSAGSLAPARPRRGRAPPRPRDAPRSPAARSRSCAASASRSEIRTYRRRAFDRATRYQLHVEGDERRSRRCVEAGVLDARHAPLERPPKRVVGRVVLPRRLPARGAPRRRLAVGAARTRIWSCGRRRSRARTSSVASPRVDGARLGVRRPRRATPSPTRKGWTRSTTCSRRPGRATLCSRLEERVGRRGHARRGEPARERRPREPRPDEPRGARAARGDPLAAGLGRLERLPDRLPRSPTSGCATRLLPLRELAAEVRAADHEGGRAPPSAANSRTSSGLTALSRCANDFALALAGDEQRERRNRNRGGSALVRRRIQTPSATGTGARSRGGGGRPRSSPSGPPTPTRCVRRASGAER